VFAAQSRQSGGLQVGRDTGSTGLGFQAHGHLTKIHPLSSRFDAYMLELFIRSLHNDKRSF